MGLSVAISGGIILTVFVLLLLSLPGLADKMFSIGDVTTQVTQHEQKISNTEISMNDLSQLSGSSKVNFTLNNDGSEKLWNFEDFDLFIEYIGTISGKRTEQLSYSGECSGAVPQAGNWCIQSIINDIADPKILNSGERAHIRTNLSQNLASTTAIVTLVTDNGVTLTTAAISTNTLESLTNVTDTGCALNQVIKVDSSGFWVCANDENTGAITTLESLTNVTDGGCADGQVRKASAGQWICADDNGIASGITSINGDTTSAQVFSGVTGNLTITDTGAGTLTFNLGTNVVMTGGSVQTVTKGLTLNALTLGGTMNSAGNTIDNVGFIADNSGAEAGSGFIRVGNGVDAVCWEQSPAGNDICESVDASENYIFDSDINNIDINSNPITNVDSITTNGADPADAGVIRMSNAEVIAWEASPASTDLTITSDASENLVLNSGWNNVDLGLNPLINSIFDVAGTGNRLTSTGTALGDLLKSDGTDFKRLARGTANQILKVNSGGTDIAWSDYPITRISGASGAAGNDITYQVLTANSADCNTVALCAASMTTTGLGSGTWKFKYTILYQSAAAGNGIGFGTDATGAVTLFNARWSHVTSGAAGSTGIGDDVATTVVGQLLEAKSGITDNAIIGSTSTGVITANTNNIAVLEGIYTTTTSGNLELKISSENAGTNVRIAAGTVLELVKIA